MNNTSYISMALFCLFASSAIACSDRESLERVLTIDPRHALMHAISTGQTEAMESLLGSKVDPNWHDEDGCTPLRLAAFQQDEEATHRLLEHGACVNLICTGIDQATSEGITVIEETEAALIHCSVERRGQVLNILLRHACRSVCTLPHLHKQVTAIVQDLKDGNKHHRANQLQAAHQEAAKALTDDIPPGKGPRIGKARFLQPPSPRWDMRSNSI